MTVPLTQRPRAEATTVHVAPQVEAMPRKR